MTITSFLLGTIVSVVLHATLLQELWLEDDRAQATHLHLIVTGDGLQLGGRPTTLQELAENPPRAPILVHAAPSLPPERLVHALGVLLDAGTEVALAVERSLPTSAPTE